MKILCFIPAYNRRQITEICYGALCNRIASAPPEFRFSVLCVVSNTADEALARKYEFITVRTPNKPLGRKFNAGLRAALEMDFDYLLQLNSDNILSISFWEAFGSLLRQRLPFFGCNHISIYDSATATAYRYLYPTGCGIRFISRKVLLGAFQQVQVHNPAARVGNGIDIPAGPVWVPSSQYKPNLYGQPLAERFRLWTPDKNRGMDFDSEVAITRAWPSAEYRQRFPAGNTPLVVDIKSEDNIHPIEEFKGDDMAQEWSRNEALQLFPELTQFDNEKQIR